MCELFYSHRTCQSPIMPSDIIVKDKTGKLMVKKRVGGKKKDTDDPGGGWGETGLGRAENTSTHISGSLQYGGRGDGRKSPIAAELRGGLNSGRLPSRLDLKRAKLKLKEKVRASRRAVIIYRMYQFS